MNSLNQSKKERKKQICQEMIDFINRLKHIGILSTPDYTKTRKLALEILEQAYRVGKFENITALQLIKYELIQHIKHLKSSGVFGPGLYKDTYNFMMTLTDQMYELGGEKPVNEFRTL